jgi:3'-phosphoadenosine 5'-phosphosulfate sulfotransferase (PAPS reductase)/FAD synthetase
MNKRWRETFSLWAQSEEYTQKVAEAKQIIEDALNDFQKPYCSFSGGKDSLVMTHLVWQMKPDIEVITLDYSRNFLPLRYLLEIKDIAKKLGWNHRVIRSRILEKDENDGIPRMMQVLNREVTPFLLREGFDLAFVGIRKEESSARKHRIEEHSNLTQIPEVHPVANFTWMDIWAYIVLQNLPYMRFYDIYAKVLGWDNVRFSTFFDKELESLGGPNLDGFFSYRYRYKSPPKQG